MKHLSLVLLILVISATACAAPASVPSQQLPTPTARVNNTPVVPTDTTAPTSTSVPLPTDTPVPSPTEPPTATPTPAPSGIIPETISNLAQLRIFPAFNLNDLGSLLNLFKPGNGGSSALPSSLFPPTYLAMAYSPDGKTLVLGGCTRIITNSYACQPPAKPILRLIDVQTGQVIREFQGHTSSITSVVFSPDGKTLVSASEATDGSIRFWDAGSGNMLRMLKIGSRIGIPEMAISPDGNTLVAAWFQNYRAWDFNTGNVLSQGISSNGTPRFNKDGSRLAIYGSDNRATLAIYDTSTWKSILSINTPSSTLQFALSPDAKTLVFGGENRTGVLHFWDTSTAKELGQLDTQLVPYSMLFSPDGKLLIVDGVYPKVSIPPKIISFVDPVERKELGVIRSLTISPEVMALSPDNLELAYADFGGDVTFWGLVDNQIEAARQVLMTYLDDLNQKKYTDAAALYYSNRIDQNSPDYQFLKKNHPQLDLNNIPAVLQATCEDKRFPCAPFRDIVSQGRLVPNGITFYVEFSKPDGSLAVSPIPCSGLPSTCEPTTAFMFNLTQSGDGSFMLASLPPAAEFP